MQSHLQQANNCIVFITFPCVVNVNNASLTFEGAIGQLNLRRVFVLWPLSGTGTSCRLLLIYHFDGVRILCICVCVYCECPPIMRVSLRMSQKQEVIALGWITVMASRMHGRCVDDLGDPNIRLSPPGSNAVCECADVYVQTTLARAHNASLTLQHICWTLSRALVHNIYECSVELTTLQR